MRITIGRLRELFRETKIGASADYMKKERVRAIMQQAVAGMVSSGEISSQEELDSAFSALDMSVKALRMIPFEVWGKLAQTPETSSADDQNSHREL